MRRLAFSLCVSLAAVVVLARFADAGMVRGGIFRDATAGSSVFGTTASLNGNTGVLITGASSCSGDAVQYDNNGVQGCPFASDAAPQALIVHPQDNYPGGSQTAANLYIRAGIDERKVAIDAADTCTAGDTVTVPINGTNQVLTYGTDWCNPSCADQAARVTSLTTAVNALTGVSATESSTTVLITPDLTTYSIGTLAESDTGCSTVTNGTDGLISAQSPISVPVGSTTFPSIYYDDGSNKHGWFFSANRINGRTSGSTVMIVDATTGITANSFDVKTNLTDLTAATMTVTKSSRIRCAMSQLSWTNAMVAALGATTTGEVSVVTLPAKTQVENAYVVITGAAAGPATVTVSVGRTGGAYIDYIVASDAKAAANTVYGDASAERGTNLTGYDLPSYTGTTTVNAQFISSGANLSTVTGSTGTIFLNTCTLP